MHLAPLIRDLAVILALAGVVSLLFQRIRQPVVVGYIIAGIIVGPHTPPFPMVTDIPSIKIWAELGVIFLMFSLGLEFSFRKLGKVGVSASLTAVMEVGGMLAAGWLLGRALGWPVRDCWFLGGMVSISSTTIIVRTLDELKLKTRRFAEMVLAVLVVEDLIAILLLVALSAFGAREQFSTFGMLQASAQLGVVVGSWFVVGYFLVPSFVRYVGRSKSDEMLMLVSLGLCLSLVVFADYFHYSSALGAFIMGSILADSSESHRIEERIAPLRDLFAAVFFVSVGMLIDPRLVIKNWTTIAAISALVLVGKTTFATLAALITGQTLRSSIQVGMGLAQIGEFSFIIAGLGIVLKATSESLQPVAVAVSLVTTLTTPYFYRYSHKVAVKAEALLPLRTKQFLARYAAWTQTSRADSIQRKLFYQCLRRWILNAFIITVIFLLAADLLIPKEIPIAGVWAFALLLSAPFAWGMLQAFASYAALIVDDDTHSVNLAALISRTATVLWLGILSLRFFPAWLSLGIAITLCGLLFAIFYRQLEASYSWFERQFLSGFRGDPKTKKPLDLLRHLAPWDAHLVRIKVHPNAEITALTLADTHLRSKHGVNVVAIQRGMRTIVAPLPSEQILPKDELLVLGTDEQIEGVRYVIEKPPGLEKRFSHVADYELKSLRLSDQTPLAGKTLKASKIGENLGVMVVGLERKGKRHINPDSNFVLEGEDVLWLVGEREKLELAFQKVN